MNSQSITLSDHAEEQLTGCRGASSYRQFCQINGFEYVEVLDWTSSAGDWVFLVSKEGRDWKMLFQTNNYPKNGFSHILSDDEFLDMSIDEVMDELELRGGL